MPRHTQDFFAVREDWSRRKHLILSYYLKPAVAKLGSTSAARRVTIIDGFAGPGKYTSGEPGSPLYICQLADECRQWRNPVYFSIYNVESKLPNFEELSELTHSWVNLGIVHNYHATFRRALPEILQRAGAQPLFAFLDPFSPKDLLVRDFDLLLQRRDKTELLIVFHTPAVMRMIRQVRPEAKTEPDARFTSLRTLSDVMGDGSWRELLDAENFTPEDIVERFVASVRRRYCEARHGFVYTHRIEARKNVDLKYHVVFLTRHIEGVGLMNDAMVKEQRDLDKREVPEGQIGFEAQFRIQALCEKLISLGRQHPERIWERSRLILDSIESSFGTNLKSEHLAAIKELIDRKYSPRVVVLDEQRAKSGRTNDETLMRFDFETPSKPQNTTFDF